MSHEENIDASNESRFLHNHAPSIPQSSFEDATEQPKPVPACDIRSKKAQPFFQPEFSSLGDPLPSHGSSSSEASKPMDEHSSFDNISHPVVIEMFCGTARVTACLKAIGLNDSFGVDHIKSKAVSTMKVADLSRKIGQDLFLEWLESPLVRGCVHRTTLWNL